MTGDPSRISARLLLWLAAAGAISGCTHIGPKTIPVDRFDYSTAIADSWKQQTLLNIVKLRYNDLPIFVDVSSIVSGYSLQTGVNFSAGVSSPKQVDGNFATAGGQAIYTDRPTITYSPLTGEKMVKSLIAPMNPKNIFFLLQSGYPADFILGLTVESLNGLRNRSVDAGTVREADPGFLRAIQLLRDVQVAGAVGIHLEEDYSKGSTAVLFFRGESLPPDITEKGAELRKLLKLPPGLQRFNLIYSPTRSSESDLAVNSRSMIQIMEALASYLEVPEEHLKNHWATPAFAQVSPDARGDVVRIRSSKDEPTGAFAAVHYRDYWFWIDDGDLETKRAMTAIMFFFTLAETGSSEKLPLVTIPAQ